MGYIEDKAHNMERQMTNEELIDKLLDRLMSMQNELTLVSKQQADTADKLYEATHSENGFRIDVATVEDMLKSMAHNRRIDAIKACRIITGYSLEEAKNLIEQAMGQTLKGPGDPGFHS